MSEQAKEKEIEREELEHEFRERMEALQARYEEECNEKFRQLEENEN
jgi:hypothetical protein